MRFAGGSMSPVGDDVVAVFEVRGEHDAPMPLQACCRWPASSTSMVNCSGTPILDGRESARCHSTQWC